MNTNRVSFLAALTLGAAMMVTGCKSAPPPAAAGVQNSDGSITNPDGSVTYPAGVKPPTATVSKNPDGSITNADGSVTYPAGVKPPQATPQPAPAAQAAQPADPASAPAKAPAAAAPAAVSRTAPTGSRVTVTITETLAASKNNVGDRFTGVLAEPVVTSSGATVFPRGTRVAGEVVAAKGRGRFKGAGDLGIQLTSIGDVRVSTSEYEKTQAGKGKRTAGMIGGGTGLGAIIGGLAGGGKGALIGGLAGAGAGTAASAYTGNKDVVIPSESAVTFTLTAPVSAKKAG
ncbi:MAG TPA: hypothetical protein VK608_02560 [Edaphobacter sp.]|nr:hypothetical protein [Edaphobacter sp.]